MKIKVFYDGIDFKNENTIIQGYTTNPSLLKQMNEDKTYKELVLPFIHKINNLPISLEVISDQGEQMISEAKELSSWGENIYIKIPIIDTEGNYNTHTIQKLLDDKINVNITCVFTQSQIDTIYETITIADSSNVIISIFCGRIADTGISPSILSSYTTKLFQKNKNVAILWASTREIYNIFEAEQCNCDIITIPESIYQKLHLIDKDLNEYSKETVQQFINDGKSLFL
tara:strand:+ start:1386 stop:2072 length:687 start_codon:yes stop_codon:yes gene_type:complete